MRALWLVLLPSLGCSSILGIDHFHLGDAGNADGPGLADASDAPGLPNDGYVCFGPTGWQLCAPSPPSGVIVLPPTLDTDTSLTCATNVVWNSGGQPDACILAGDTISGSVTTTVTGSRPLVLLASQAISISATATIDVASLAGGAIGAGANPTTCGAFVQAPATLGGAGAGGGFVTQGGDGGASGSLAPGGRAALASGPPGTLRGGCRGQTGADGQDVGSAGALGEGGGAVYLVAGNTLSLAGVINASGAGARGAAKGGGGGGGGGGGMIILYAPTITASNPRLLANGGSGSGGGGGTPGSPGADPVATSPLSPAVGGTGGSGNGCGGIARGGNGFAGGIAAAIGVAGSGNGACGGGGGGGGGGYIRANVSFTATASPAVTIVP
jgi:hypothetical protein